MSLRWALSTFDSLSTSSLKNIGRFCFCILWSWNGLKWCGQDGRSLRRRSFLMIALLKYLFYLSCLVLMRLFVCILPLSWRGIFGHHLLVYYYGENHRGFLLIYDYCLKQTNQIKNRISVLREHLYPFAICQFSPKPRFLINKLAIRWSSFKQSRFSPN